VTPRRRSRGLSDRRSLRFLALAALLACAISAPAQAGTVDATDGVVFTAAPGETNNLTITQSGNSFTIVDNWPLTALGPCSSTDMFTAVCTTTAEAVAARLGDLDDSAVIVVVYTPRVRGGDGADTITTSAELPYFSEDNSVKGGPGNDVLANEGEAGSIINAGAGDDKVSTRAFGDIIDGGAGNDLVDARKGDASEGRGGPGDDRLLGGSGQNSFYGGGGYDTLIGGAGFDQILGGPGRDVVRGQRGGDVLYGDRGTDLIRGGAGGDWTLGGRGNDTFLMRDAARDRVNGGRGRDRARSDRGLDRIFHVEILF
jgi:Ca2+-binding RTX toxin-like protein